MRGKAQGIRDLGPGVALLLLLACVGQAADLRAPLQRYTVVRVHPAYDGDTVDLDLLDGFDRLAPITLRVYGIDTPEYHRLASREAAIVSRDYLRKRLAECEWIEVVVGTAKDGRVQRDSFGRVLGKLLCDQKNLAEEMIELELGERYER